MTQVLLRVRHKVEPLYPHHVDNTQAGDVIVEVPDGHSWGIEEAGLPEKGYFGNPDWRIIQLPEIPFGAFGDMEQLEPGQPGAHKYKRMRYFDLSQLPALRAVLAFNKVVSLTGQDAIEFLSARRTRPPRHILIG